MTVDLLAFTALIRDTRHMDARAAPDLADWLVRLELEGKADRTVYQYHRYGAALLRAYPDTALADFTPDQIEAFLARQPKGSRHIVRSVLSQWFQWAALKERVDRDPMMRVAKIRHPERSKHPIFSLADVAALEALPSPWGQYFAILFGTGLRKAEMRNLRRRDIDLDRSRLIVRQGKGGKDRVVVLMPSAAKAVADLDLLEQLRPDDFIWHTNPGGGDRRMRRWPVADTTFSRHYKRCLEAARVTYRKPHTTRHTFHELCRMAGLDLEERQAMMGHASIRTTIDVYGHLDFDAVAEKLAGFTIESAR